MLFVAGTFVIVLGIIIGAYWVFVALPETREQATLRKRLKVDRTVGAQELGVLKAPERFSSVEALNTALQRAGRFASPLQRLIAQSGLQITVGTLLLSSGCLALVTYLVVYRFSRLTLVAIAAGLLAAFLPLFYLRRARDKRVIKFEEQFPEAIALIARALRAGHAFTTGLAMVADEIPDPVGTEFKLLYDRQNYGMPLPDALRSFAERVPLLDARFFATAVLMQRETGGNLSEVLDNLSSVIRDRFRVKRQVRVITAHGRMTGWILAALPPALAIALFLIVPDHLRMLIADPLGVQMIVGAVLLQVAGTLIIRKLVNVPY